VLERLDILAVHTDEEGTIRCFYPDIDIISYNIDRYVRRDDTEPSPEL
jgi:hypothetical protein